MLTTVFTAILSAIHWHPDPVIFSIGSWSIRWYGLLYATAFISCYYAFQELTKRDNIPVERIDSLLIHMILGTIIGARIGDCLFYNASYYLQHPIEILYIHRGGLSSHGGACGILISLNLYARKYKIDFIWVLDHIAIVVGLAGFFIRMGNLMNSEIYGIETDLPWGFIFERRGETLPKHPTMLYESFYYLACYLLLRRIYRLKEDRPRPYFIFGLFLVMVFVFRVLVEFIKNPQEDFEAGMALNMGQLLSLPFIALGVWCLWKSRDTAWKPLPKSYLGLTRPKAEKKKK